MEAAILSPVARAISPPLMKISPLDDRLFRSLFTQFGYDHLGVTHDLPPTKADYGQLLSDLISRYGISIRPSDFHHWRPVSKAGGYITGFSGMVYLLCTDGCVGWFVQGFQPGNPTFLGHLDNFSGPVSYWSIDYVDEWDHERRCPKLTERERKEREIVKKREVELRTMLDELLA
jgi:hypothetical protein